MSRIILLGANYDVPPWNEINRTLTGLDITCKYVGEFQKGLESVLESCGARNVPDSSYEDNLDIKIPTLHGEFEIIKKKDSVAFEFKKKGSANLDTSYILIKHPTRLRDPRPDYLSIKLNLEGNEKLWDVGSEVVKKIIEYISKKGALFRLLRNEITTNDGKKIYIKGAKLSKQDAEKNGLELIKEQSYHKTKQP